jgi:hypothetical protein
VSAYLESNLAALEGYPPEIREAVSAWEAPGWLTLAESRSGDPTAAVRRGGEEVAIHSRYDPRREAERLVRSVAVGATVVVEGFGLGYHIEALLAERKPFRVLVLDKDVSLLAAAARSRDLAQLFRDPRVSIAVAVGAPEIHGLVGELFQPLFSRALESLSLTPWTRTDPEWFSERRRWFAAAAEGVLDDVAAQCRFGFRWTRNSIVNLATPGTFLAPESGGASGRAVVTAAGPSLPGGLKSLGAEDAYLVATDTSLPSLDYYGAVPREVMSIDCQQVSYHHFFRQVPTRALVRFEAASPPSLLRRGAKTTLFLGEHPLHAYIAGRLPGLLRIDTKGGNVTFAAVDYLRGRGFREIDILGADYGYPRLVAYTNPSFLQHHFQARSTLLAPLESLIAGFALDRLPEGQRSTPLLKGYRRSLDALVGRHGGSIEDRGPGHLGVRFPGTGSGRESVLGPRGPNADPGPSAAPAPEGFATGGPEITRVLSEYHRKLSDLDIEKTAGEMVAGVRIARAELEVFLTLVPVAHAWSAASSRADLSKAPAPELLRIARRWTLALLESFYPVVAE